MKFPYDRVLTGLFSTFRNTINKVIGNIESDIIETNQRVTDVDNKVNTRMDGIDEQMEVVNNKSVHFDGVDAELAEHAELIEQLKASSIDGEVIAARNGFPSLLDFLKSLNPGATIATKTFTATAGQTDIDLTDTGELQAVGKIILFLIDGAPQWSSYEWVSTTKLRMKSPFAGGSNGQNPEQVVIRYFVGNVSIRTGHGRGHEKGGFDEVDAYKIKNGDVIRDSIDALQRKTKGYINLAESAYDSLKVAITGGYDYAPAINAALSSSYQYIFVPDGDNLVNSSILIPSDTTLVLSYNANIIRNFSGAGSSLATIRNKNLSTTNRDKNIGLFGGCIKAADSSKIGKHIVFWGVDTLKLTDIKTREVYGDWSTNFRDCYDTLGEKIDIDTKGSAIYTDGLHITGGKRYSFNLLTIKSGDDCISLTVETPEDTDIDDVKVTNASLITKRSSIIKMTTKIGTTPKIKNVKLLNITGSSVGVFNQTTQQTDSIGETIVIKDEDNAGRISDITLGVTADASFGAGTGLRIQGVDKIYGKVSILNPQGKGSDLSYINKGKLEIVVKGQRTDSISAISMANIDGFTLIPDIENAKLHGVAVGRVADPNATPPIPNGPVTNSKIVDGSIKGSVNTDIRLINAIGVDVLNNYCSGANGIIEDSGASDWNRISGNDVRSVAGTKISSNGTNSRIPNTNKGYLTYNRGTYTLPASSTSVKVPHGLSAVPSAAGVKITLTSPKGAAGTIHRDIVSVNNTDADNFTVASDVAPGVPVTFTWSAETSKYA